ncbi:MAG: hypothetical protein B7X53_07430 [Hyphomonas sp. 34-62-18]|nr:DUF4345 family protein [Hyphomonas sp. 34-62-18]OZB17021.1 MAG: hypothetical protein B7X53_07430 [Hyphomonas sp. 34-62-18]
MFTKLFLGLVAALFALFGAVSLANPIGMAESLGVAVGGPNGAYELRGIYGGVSLAAALLFAAGAIRPSLTLPALWFLIVYMGGYVFARVFALLLGPAPTSVYIGFVAFEVFVLAGALVCLRAAPRR